MKSARAATRRPLATSPFATRNAAPVPTFEVNDRVTHERFGLGTVVSVERTDAVVVDFGAQRVRVESPFRKLIKL